MTLLTASFEVAPSGSAIPATGGPDGFGDGWNGSGTSFVSDASVAGAVASGALAGKMAIGSTAAQNYRGWSWSGGVVHLRQYLYLTAAPNARFTWWENWTSGGFVTRIRINADLTVGLSDGLATWATTAPIPLNTLCRLEASFNHAAGSMSLALYVGNSTTAISGGTASVTGRTFSSSTVSWVYGGVQSTLTNYTIRTDGWAVSDTAQPGPLVTGGTVTGGTTASATASAAGGSVNAVVGETVTITGVTAQAVAQGGVRPAPPAPPEADPLWPPDPYRSAIRSGSYSVAYLFDASLGDVPVEGAQDLRPYDKSAGTITDTTKPGVRRVLNTEIVPNPGRTFQELFGLLAPVGTRLKATARITYLNRHTLDIPMGVFEVDSESLSEGGGGGVSITAPDKWAAIQLARFVGPASSQPGLLVVDQIAALIRGALGSDEPVAVSATSTAVMGPMVWEKDRDKAIIDLATSIGAWVYFDRNGLATIADIPTIGASADWLIDASPSGVLTELDRKRSRENTYNVVVVESSSTDAPFTTQVAWDNDPSSPTYCCGGAGGGTMADFNAALAGGVGPFGVVTYYHDTPLPLGDGGALATAFTILFRVTGLASQVSLGQVPNPALDAFDVLDVLAPQERRDIPRSLERHVADTVTHPLTLGTAQHIEGRSTRTDEFQ